MMHGFDRHHTRKDLVAFRLVALVVGQSIANGVYYSVFLWHMNLQY